MRQDELRVDLVPTITGIGHAVTEHIKDQAEHLRVFRKAMAILKDPRGEAIGVLKWEPQFADFPGTVFRARVGKSRIVYGVKADGSVEFLSLGDRKDIYNKGFPTLQIG